MLDTGMIDPASVTVSATTVSWTNAGARRQVDLGGPQRTRAAGVKAKARPTRLARVDAKADDGKTPGNMAVERGHKEVAEWLAGKKA